jgi:polyhydroxybutyrate depolymerase
MKNLFLSGVALIPVLLSLLSSASDKLPKDTLYSIKCSGIKRTYLLHIPSGLDTSKSIPLLIALHGGHGTGKRMIELTSGGFNTLADQENFIVVYPNGIGRNWNDGRLNMPASYKAQNSNIDDVGFISALIDEIVKTKNADPKRVYVTGMSNGALMTQRLAIELSNKIAAAAPVCGNIPSDLKSTPKQEVAIMIINGTSDPLVPYEGGFIHFRKKNLGKVTSTNESVSFWLKNNKINATPLITELPDTNISDSCHVRKTSYGESSDAGEVVLITIEGGGHTWAGGWQYLNEKWIGKTCRDIDACKIIWEFCKMHAK